MTWSFFHPSARVPRFLEYIEDKDFHHWKLPESREFSEGMAIEPLEFLAYNRFYIGDDEEAEQKVIQDTIDKGRVIMEYIKFNISRLTTRAFTANWCGYWVKILNSATWMSEIGHLLSTSSSEKEPPIDFALVWNYDHRKESINCSLRTDPPGLDLSLIAQHYGGGGHAAAAGFAFQGSIKKLLKTSFLPGYAPMGSGSRSSHGGYHHRSGHQQQQQHGGRSHRGHQQHTQQHQHVSYGAHPGSHSSSPSQSGFP